MGMPPRFSPLGDRSRAPARLSTEQHPRRLLATTAGDVVIQEDDVCENCRYLPQSWQTILMQCFEPGGTQTTTVAVPVRSPSWAPSLDFASRLAADTSAEC